ncbi:MAG: biopolymer transporter ExbD [candidate division WOR-3 bacterium]|nr:biopolymer transporter ExbD [candidate division WOR-3 bacterium]MCX7837098.1 biopolymer transporter ExbD [candidate division WOR-3 bacterium]MDW8114474.1 biopolymer transporter ExbD [candidate division WOR-3 bacterium]
MLRKRVLKRKNNLTELNITSLVDIALTLVIGFIVALPYFFESGIFVSQAKLAKSESAPSEKELKISIYLTKDDEIILNEKKMNLTTLKNLLPQLLLRSLEKRVLIGADTEVKYEKIIKILDICKESGAKELTLIRKK